MNDVFKTEQFKWKTKIFDGKLSIWASVTLLIYKFNKNTVFGFAGIANIQ